MDTPEPDQALVVEEAADDEVTSVPTERSPSLPNVQVAKIIKESGRTGSFKVPRKTVKQEDTEAQRIVEEPEAAISAEVVGFRISSDSVSSDEVCTKETEFFIPHESLHDSGLWEGQTALEDEDNKIRLSDPRSGGLYEKRAEGSDQDTGLSYTESSDVSEPTEVVVDGKVKRKMNLGFSVNKFVKGIDHSFNRVVGKNKKGENYDADRATHVNNSNTDVSMAISDPVPIAMEDLEVFDGKLQLASCQIESTGSAIEITVDAGSPVSEPARTIGDTPEDEQLNSKNRLVFKKSTPTHSGDEGGRSGDEKKTKSGDRSWTKFPGWFKTSSSKPVEEAAGKASGAKREDVGEVHEVTSKVHHEKPRWEKDVGSGIKVLQKYGRQLTPLITKEFRTLLAVAVVFNLQLLIAFLLRDAAIWKLVVCAYCLGSVFTQFLISGVHEISHRTTLPQLLTNYPKLDRFCAIFANLPLGYPLPNDLCLMPLDHLTGKEVSTPKSWIPFPWELRLQRDAIKRLALLSLCWLSHAKRVTPPACLVGVCHIVAHVTFNLAVINFLGLRSLLYLLLCGTLGNSLHPMAGHVLLSQYTFFNKAAAASSCYSPLNRLLFNKGFHREHEDFPSVPWMNLKTVSNFDPTIYRAYPYRISYIKVIFNYIVTGLN